MEATDGVPDMLPVDEFYFDVEAMLADVRLLLNKPDAGIKPVARALGVNRVTLRRLIRGQNSVNLETYARMLAAVGRPYGSWLRLK